jgi:hypothetical protein
VYLTHITEASAWGRGEGVDWDVGSLQDREEGRVGWMQHAVCSMCFDKRGYETFIVLTDAGYR